MYDHKKFLKALSEPLYKFLELRDRVVKSDNGLMLIPELADQFPSIDKVNKSVKGKVIRVSYDYSLNSRMKFTYFIKITKYDIGNGLIGDGFCYKYRTTPNEYIKDLKLNIEFDRFYGLGGTVISAEIAPESEFKDKIKFLLKHSDTIL